MEDIPFQRTNPNDPYEGDIVFTHLGLTLYARWVYSAAKRRWEKVGEEERRGW